MPINPNSLSGSADKLTLAFAPSNSTPTIEGHTDATNQLSAILNGVDDKILHSEPYDVVGGRLDWVSTSSIRWSFLNSNQIRLYNPTSAQWELVKCSAEPTLTNNADDINGTALAPNTIYDVFAEYDSSTAFNLVLSRWATGGDGANNSSTSYATPVMTANNAPGPIVVSATSYFNSDDTYNGWKAFTQNSGNEWASNAAPNVGVPQSIMVDFGVAVCVNKYAFQSVSNATASYRRIPSTFKLQGSNDTVTVSSDTGWIDLDTRAGVSEPGQSAWTPYFTFSNSTSYRYYRIRTTASTGDGSYANLAEIKLVAASNSLAGSSSRVRAYEATVTYNIGDRVTYGGKVWVKNSSAAANTTPTAGNDWVDNGYPTGGDGAYNASTAYATPIATGATTDGVTFSATGAVGSSAYFAFNRTTSTDWTAVRVFSTIGYEALGVDFGSGSSKVVNKYRIQNENVANYTGDSPTAWTLRGSNSASPSLTTDGDWTVLHTVSGVSWSGQAQWSSYYSFVNHAAYRHYSIKFTAINGTPSVNWLGIGEIHLVEAQDDFTGLYRHNGVLVSDSSDAGKSRRWLGIIYTYNNSGTVNFKDDVNYRYVSNVYNRVSKAVKTSNSNGNWQYTAASWQEWNNGTGQTRGNMVLAFTQVSLIQHFQQLYAVANAANMSAGVSINSVSTPDAYAYLSTASAFIATVASNQSVMVIPGYNWITGVNKGDGSNANYFYGSVAASGLMEVSV